MKEKKNRETGCLKSTVGDQIQGKKLRIKTPFGARGGVWVVDSPIPVRKFENGQGKTDLFVSILPRSKEF